MKELSLVDSGVDSMSIREIAKFIVTRPQDILRSVSRLEVRGLVKLITKSADGTFWSKYDQRLDRYDSILVVAQNVPEFTKAIIKRWEELEEAIRHVPTQELIDNYSKAVELSDERIKGISNPVSRSGLIMERHAELQSWVEAGWLTCVRKEVINNKYAITEEGFPYLEKVGDGRNGTIHLRREGVAIGDDGGIRVNDDGTLGWNAWARGV